ncbi:MAG: hypothetical protein CVU98_00795 [Firmicutes bacterium HGW-Firmicutes-3]|jgi:saccharopine dehydrogenase-like NADP-dependent oxidoreductase|nr:MAG: hypothetical protein CVU98_00795 [Firmicutes bacterium HGW-Firmicutes-3]
MKTIPKILVIGASGVLGKLICRETLRVFNNNVNLLVGDYRRDRGRALALMLGPKAEYQYIDASNSNSIKVALKDVSCVIISMNQNEPLIQTQCIEAKIHCIDVTASSELLDKVKPLNKKAIASNIALVMFSGFFPGLSGILIKDTSSDFERTDEVNIGLLSSVNAQAGYSGFIQMLEVCHKPVVLKHKNQEKTFPGFYQKTYMHFSEPFGRKHVRLVNYSERAVLAQYLNIPILNYWIGLEKEALTMALGILKKIRVTALCLKNRILGKFFTKVLFKHNPDKPETTALSISVHGTQCGISKTRILTLKAYSDYGVTAAFNAALCWYLVYQMSSKSLGVRFPFEIVTLSEILSIMATEGVTIDDKWI